MHCIIYAYKIGKDVWNKQALSHIYIRAAVYTIRRDSRIHIEYEKLKYENEISAYVRSVRTYTCSTISDGTDMRKIKRAT